MSVAVDGCVATAAESALRPASAGVPVDPVGELRAGRPVVLGSTQGGEPVGLVVVAGSLVTATTMAFVVRHCSGLVFVTVSAPACQRLGLPGMPWTDEDGPAGAMRVTVDAAEGIGTGISARDRARTARLLADPGSVREDFNRPGHMVPVRVDSVVEGSGPAQQVADFVRSAGLGSCGVYSHLVTPDSARLARHSAMVEFADRYRLGLVEQESVA
ncbi:3,4-dihydroxy-2-butanone-4-phosphate synthase [Sciscionella marina]|uniref:3,4-dihydroxy-2-butanone-4-phosphate synthase n=1 Tax=Sciscionella marina TaxID=508770 RepID=UPI000364E7B2|nr:3,4-dihydroxy-2-butanone-4-phosphate synthase [Sciscionella marina]